MSTLAALQKRAGVAFQDEALLRRALTHRSYLNEHPDESEDNERLEYLGDAVLDFMIADLLYHRYPEMDEGQLTRMRSALVRTEQLAALARELSLGKSIRLGRGESEAGGRDRDSVLCSTFEAVVGALYLDSGLVAVAPLVERLFLPVSYRIYIEQADVDAKSRLQEWAQSQLGHTPHYRTVAEEGPDHSKQFTVEVRIKGETFGSGTGKSKQLAAQAAALDALRRIKESHE